MTSHKDWYSPSAIKFKAEHINWIIENYETLSEGRWPLKHTGYIDNPFAPGSRKFKAGASFETPMDILAEFHWRLGQCGRDGICFIYIKCEKKDDREICQLMGIDLDRLDRILKQVFSYIKGWRKERSYQELTKRWSPRYWRKNG